MSVIKNHKTGMWEVRTYYKDLTGERKQKTKRGFAKKSEALEWERNFKLKENQSISMSFVALIYLYPWLRAVDDHYIKIVKSHIRKSLVNACFGIFISFMFCSNLGYNE